MKKVLLWAGVFAGGAGLVIGLLGLASVPDQAPADQADTVTGAIFFIVLGAVFLVPCLVLLIRANRRGLIPVAGLTGPGLPPTAAAAALVPESEPRFRQWFGWPQNVIVADLASPNATPKPSKRKLGILAGIAAATLPLLEPDEQVLVAVRGLDRSDAIGWQLALGWIGQLIAASQQSTYYVVFTDRRVLAFTSSQYERRPRYVKWGLPRSAVTQAKIGWRLFGTRALTIGWPGARLRLTVARTWRSEAEYAASLIQAAVAGGALQPADPSRFSSRNSW